MAQTVFERAGGFAAVRKIVSALYDRVFESERLAPYFEDVPMPRMIDHQTKFVASIMGGPASISDEQLLRAHARLSLSRADFQEMLALFRDVLEDAALDPSDIDQVEREMARKEAFVVSQGG